MPLLYNRCGYLFRWVGAFHARGADYFILHSDTRLLTHFTLPHFVWPCLLWPSSVVGNIPLLVHYLPASMGIDVIPSALCTCSFQSLQPNHFTCGLHPSSLDAPVDVHGISHNFLFFHPREALLVGCQVTTLPIFSCGIFSSSPPLEVVLHGWGWYTCPVYDGCPYTRECQSLTWWEEVSFSGGLMTIQVSSSLHKRGHQLQFYAPPPKSLLPTYPWSSSFPSRYPPSLVPGHQVSSSLCLFFCHITISVGMLPWLIGPALPAECSSIYPSQKLNTCPNSWQRPLSWGPHCCQQWGRWSRPGA